MLPWIGSRPVGFLLALLFATPLLSLNPGLSIGQYLHTRWTGQEGTALPPIRAIAQSNSGYLWLGTSTGLIRFDGMRFVEWSPSSGPALPGPDVRSLRAASDGGLWIGTRDGACKLDRNTIRRYPALDNVCNLASSLLEDPVRGLWMVNQCNGAGTIMLLSPDGSLKTFGPADGLPDQDIQSLFQDRQGSLWVGTSTAVCQWSPGSPAACSKGPAIGPVSIAGDHHGILIADSKGSQVLRLFQGTMLTVGPRMPGVSFMRGMLLRDRDGVVWIGTVGKGLVRLAAGRVDRFTAADGLSGNLITGLLEDSEGDLWVATAGGLDRFRDPGVLHFSTRDGLSGDLVSAVLTAQDGAVWVGTATGLNRVVDRKVARYSTASGLPANNVVSLFEDSTRRLWVGTPGGLAVQSGERFVEVLTADGRRLNRVFNIVGNPAGDVWLADEKQGLFTVNGGVATPVTLDSIGGRAVFHLFLAKDGALWVGFYNGGISVLRGRAETHYQAGAGLAPGTVRDIYQDRTDTIWVATEGGLSRFHDSRFTTWTSAHNLPAGGVQNIVEDNRDGLWLMTAAGLLRVTRASLDEPPKPLPYILYGRTEGLRLNSVGAQTNPRLTRARDGRLWFCTDDGAAIVDPACVRINPVPPPVVIEQVTLDGRDLDPAAAKAGFRGRNLQIVYNGISLMVPERVHLRYRLHGLDPEWTDAGARRSVSYVDLGPGAYRFQVIARNNDGVWNNVGADLPLLVTPYYYETRWFWAACVGVALLIAWSVHWFRLRRVVARYQLIAAERMRFTRELHDSLLQGFAGVVYLLEAAVRQFDADPAASKQRLSRAVDQADESLREARQMILRMRIPALENSTLPEALIATAKQMVEGLPVQFDLKVNGRVRQGSYDLEANLFLIVREAVTNALNHSNAPHIGVEMNYSRKQLQVIVTDDGAGFDPEAALAKSGHWGLRGMQERARQIGATLTVDSAPTKGARLEISVPWKT